jgi:hypothetical protein
MDKLEEHIIVIRTKLSETVSVNSSNNNGENAANKTIITIGTAFGVALLTGLITTIVHLALK